jgi:Cof subfamily protein (haloacid dehalogenase superfamily)
MVQEEDLQKAGQHIRLIVCDLDGTLLNSRKLISSENLAAINEARVKGIFVTICSGRVPAMLEAYSQGMDIRGPLIAANGGIVVDTRTGDLVWKKLTDPEGALALLQFCRLKGLDHILVSSEGCWYGKDSKRILRFEHYNRIAQADALTPIPLLPLGTDYRSALGGEIYKLLVAGLGEEEMRMTEEYIRSIGTLACTSSEPGLLDVAAPGVDKGEGVRNLARLMGLEKQQICVFGDFLNDIPMFEQAGMPIAMANGDEKTKARALTVTASNDEDGVGRAIRRYIL